MSKSDEGDAGKMSVAELMVEMLVAAGVTHVFGGHGGAVITLVNAINAHPDVQWVYMRNEQSASLAACAHAKYTGGLGCCLATSGPGATHLTTGLACAVKDGLRVLCLTGLKPAAKIGHADFQDVDQSVIFRAAGVNFSMDVPSSGAAFPLLRNAIDYAWSQRSCAHLATPIDVQSEDVKYLPPGVAGLRGKELFEALHKTAGVQKMGLKPAKERFANLATGEYWDIGIEPKPSAVEEAASILTEAGPDGYPERIAIVVGWRAVGAGKAILELAETLNAPVIEMLDAKGIVDEGHPLVIGVTGIFGNPGLEAPRAAIYSAEVVLSFGLSDGAGVLSDGHSQQDHIHVEVQPDQRATAGLGWQSVARVYGSLSLCAAAIKAKVEEKLAPGGEGVPRDAIGVLPSQRDELLSTWNAAFTLPKMRSLEHVPSVIATKTLSVARSFVDRWRAKGNVDDDGNVKLTIPHDTREMWSYWYTGKWRERGRKVAGTYAGSTEYMLNPNGPKEGSDPMEWIKGAYGYDAPADHPYCHPMLVFNELASRLPAKAVCCIDTGDSTLFFSVAGCLTKHQRCLVDMAMGTMGYALCAGIAAALEDPEAIPVCIVGDGAFQMTIGELAVVQQLLPDRTFVIIVAKNGLLGRVHFGWAGVEGTEVDTPDLVKLAGAYGGTGESLATNDRATVVKAVENAISAKGLHILEVMVDEETAAPMVGKNG